MRVAIAGLATSHPYSDAGHLRELLGAELTVWEPDRDRLARFLDQHPARVVDSLDALLADGPDGAVVTVRPDQVAPLVQALLERDIPVFANKPAAVTLDQLARLDAIVSPRAERFMTCSVLRFAPAFERFRQAIVAADVLAARVTVRHDVSRWSTDPSVAWQDDPGVGGGLLTTMGVHGVELLVMLFGTDIVDVRARRSRRRYLSLASEDVGQIDLRWASGLIATVEILGVASSESYAVCVHGDAADREVVLRPDGQSTAPFGYAETIEAFGRMLATGASAVDWATSRCVLHTLATARANAGDVRV